MAALRYTAVVEKCLGICNRKPLRLALAHVRRSSVRHLERRTVLRPRSAVIVDPRGGDVGVAKPFLHLLAMSALWSSALVAAVARSAWAPISNPRCAE